MVEITEGHPYQCVQHQVDLVHHLDASFHFGFMKAVVSIKNHIEEIDVANHHLLKSIMISEQSWYQGESNPS